MSTQKNPYFFSIYLKKFWKTRTCMPTLVLVKENYKIIWIVCVFWLVYKCVFIALWSTKWREQCGSTVSELWEFTVCASYIIFLFVNIENNNFIKEIKHVVCAFIVCWEPQQSLWELSSRWKPSTASQVFTDLFLNSPKRSPRFSPGTENMFYFLINK